MCGIAGLFDLRGQQDFDRDLLASMNQTQFHRGPDEGGEFVEPGVALAHRRLSIIDPSSGQQPMHSADGNLCVVYNGKSIIFANWRTSSVSAATSFAPIAIPR
ncbi:MAG: hypothetical protein R3E50_16005 [Halioglobus sp.]